MVKLALSNKPEREGKQFGNVALICGILSLLLWFFGIVAVATGVRGAILSNRAKNKKYLAFSIVGIVLGMLAIVYYYMSR